MEQKRKLLEQVLSGTMTREQLAQKLDNRQPYISYDNNWYEADGRKWRVKDAELNHPNHVIITFGDNSKAI